MAKQFSFYQDIANDIENLIKTHNFDYETPICTEKSLCEKYKVSRTTARNAIISLEDKNILYRIRGIGSFVVKPGSKNALEREFAMIVPYGFTQKGSFQVIESANQVLFRLKHHFSIHASHTDMHENAKLLENLFNRHIDGLAYYLPVSNIPLESLNAFVKRKKPVIFMDKKSPYPEFSSIVCDNYRGGYLLTEHLLSYGHTRLCFLFQYDPHTYSSGWDRYRGYADCLAASPQKIKPRSFYWDNIGNESPSYYYSIKNAVKTLYQQGITAILCEHDITAFNVHLCCQNMNIRIPEDMSITGFDNNEWATAGNAQITTIDQNYSLIGSTLAETLLAPDYKPHNHTIPVFLVPRASTGEVRG